MKNTSSQHNDLLRSAKEMRRNATPAEDKLWAALRNRQLAGLKFRRQHVIGPFIADFYCSSARLVVEVDGVVHDNQTEYDTARTRRFEEYGYRVIRFRNEMVLNAIEKVLSQIAEAALTPNPSPDSGRGEQESAPQFGNENKTLSQYWDSGADSKIRGGEQTPELIVDIKLLSPGIAGRAQTPLPESIVDIKLPSPGIAGRAQTPLPESIVDIKLPSPGIAGRAQTPLPELGEGQG